MRTAKAIVILAFALGGLAAFAMDAPNLIIQRSQGLPITAMSFTFRGGSADDPAGMEGLANLTARLMREGGVEEAPALDGTAGGKTRPARSRAEIEELLFPLSAEIEASTDK